MLIKASEIPVNACVTAWITGKLEPGLDLKWVLRGTSSFGLLSLLEQKTWWILASQSSEYGTVLL